MVLLEVVLAMALFFMGSLVVLAGLNTALRTGRRIDLEAQAEDLAVTLLSEIQMGLVAVVDDGPNPYDDEALAGWSWQVATEPIEDTLGLDLPAQTLVEVIIRYDAEGYVYRLSEIMAEQPGGAGGDDGGGGEMFPPAGGGGFAPSGGPGGGFGPPGGGGGFGPPGGRGR
ncbi:MAG: hypothetical protein J7M21_02290 [Planctomycetes bacterium]|nr:hypothetical protein [Planctomycetota bacterium]